MSNEVPKNYSPIKTLRDVKFSDTPMHLGLRTHDEMKGVLMTPKAEGPATHYYMIRGGGNVTVWEPGLVGEEYVKTYGHYHVGDLDETYRVLHGNGIAILQTLATDASGKMIADIVNNIKIFPVQSGDVIYMPPGCGHLFANTGTEFFVTIDDSPVSFGEKQDEASMPGHADYESVKHMHGFAYYVVEHDGQPALVRNSNYKEIKNQDLGNIPVVNI
jgi:glucose-6-phosphate isomerase, archaeal